MVFFVYFNRVPSEKGLRRDLRSYFFDIHGRCLTVTVAEGTVSKMSVKPGALHS